MSSEVKVSRLQVFGNEEIDNNTYCPLPLDVIPNQMGINLCSVRSVEWVKRDDGQLETLTINFIPNPDGDPRISND